VPASKESKALSKSIIERIKGIKRDKSIKSIKSKSLKLCGAIV
jgi:hypothetical protein